MDRFNGLDIPVLVGILLLGLMARFSGWGRGMWPPRDPRG
jgi:hypothetical protein